MGLFSKEELNGNYIIVEATKRGTLMEYVNEKLENGYICQGGVSEWTHGFIQAMIKQN